MNNILVLPLIVPIITAVLLVFLNNHIKLQRIVSLITMIFVAGVSVVLLQLIQTEGIMRLDFSGWAQPLVLFRCSLCALLRCQCLNMCRQLQR